MINGNSVVKLPFPIQEAKEVDGTVIMVLEVPNESTFSRNVFGYVLKEARIWQIEKYYPNEEHPTIVVTSISPKDVGFGLVRLDTWVCVLVTVDVRSGNVVATECSK